jgi:hypothetical protein
MDVVFNNIRNQLDSNEVMLTKLQERQSQKVHNTRR